MLFFLATPESSIIQTKTTKIRVHLSSGIAEILEEHQDLMGRIDNDVVEFELNSDNKVEISKKNAISATSQGPETAVYVYGKRIFEINSKTKSLLDEISKEFESKLNLLQQEEQKMNDDQNKKETNDISASYELVKTSNFLLLRQEVDFLRKVITVLKEFK